MPEDDKRAADTLEEIRDLLIEMRDAEEARAEVTRKAIEDSQKLAQMQKMVWLVAVLILFPATIWLVFMLIDWMKNQ